MNDDTSPRDGDPEPPAELDVLRDRIMELDDEIIRLIGERSSLAVEIGRVKQELGLPVLDPAREARVVRRVAERAREQGADGISSLPPYVQGYGFQDILAYYTALAKASDLPTFV